MSTKCKVKGCKNPVKSKGMCQAHYHKSYRKSNPERLSYECMIRRCYEESNNRYYRYGARGIRVCDRWRNSFDNFLSDMGPKPFPGAHIDRKDSDGHYTPENCKWSSVAMNNRNKSNVKITMEKAREIRHLSEICNAPVFFLTMKYGVSKSTIYRILKREAWREDVA